MKKIVLTGGGTAGHVTPNIALIEPLKAKGYEIVYIGSRDGIEKKLITELGIEYHGVSTGKFRRYFDPKNLTDPFRVNRGIAEAKKLLKEIKPDVVFSKGGFVAVPVVVAASSLKIPIVCHESDITPGLANRLTLSSATKICCNFPETLSLLPPNKAVVTGSPIRAELFSGSREKALEFTGLKGEKPVLLVMGGSLGSVAVNTALRGALPQLLPVFDIVHLCGKGKKDDTLEGKPGYVQYEYIYGELPDLLALSSLCLSRAGANAICELLALRKPALLIPLSAKVSRGDQILNAESFRERGFADVLAEEDMTPEVLCRRLLDLQSKSSAYIEAMERSGGGDARDAIISVIEKCANGEISREKPKRRLIKRIKRTKE